MERSALVGMLCVRGCGLDRVWFGICITVGLAVLLVTSIFPCFAATVRVDLLDGLGDFEQVAPVSEWESYYRLPSFDNPDYDFASNSLYFTESRGTYSYRTGVDASVAGDRIASGWRRVTGSTVNPGKNIIYDVVQGGIGGTNCQYLALKDMADGLVGHIELESLRHYVAKLRRGLSPGDEVTFAVDHIRMSDYEGISGLSYFISIQTNVGVTTKRLNPSDTPFSAEVTTTIDESVSFVSAKVVVEGPVPPGRRPGVFVDGAHLYIKRLGSLDYETRQQPLTKTRAVNTVGVFHNLAVQDSLSVAYDCDHVVLGLASDYAWVKHLKSLNSNLKIFTYLNSRPTKQGAKDPYFANSAVGYYFAVANHPEWLFLRNEQVPGEYAFCPEWPSEYWARLWLDDYCGTWVANALARVHAAQSDGVFVDNLSPANKVTDSNGNLLYPQLDVWAIQKFLRTICRAFGSASLEVMGNACGFDLNSGSGSAIFDPFWQPTEPYVGPEYSANTPETTVKHIFQEWSFVRPIGGKMVYDKSFWMVCIRNMEAVKRWNQAIAQKQLSPGLYKYLHAYVDLSAATYDSAFGPDGWRRFALCSYLLAQNEWTTFGWSAASLSGLCPLDLSFTFTMGEPLGEHQPYNGDEYMRIRKYGRPTDGTVLSVVVVNANPDTARTYVAEFDGVDELGQQIIKGEQITLPPCSGRVFLKQTGTVVVRVRTSAQNVKPGQTVTISVDYTCTGQEEAHNVVIRSQIPAQMNYVFGSAEKSGGKYDPVTNTVSWVIGTVPPGQSGTRSFQATVR
ncbi:MAG: putative glycoside hydrolase [Armatimonadota bacterium]|nr:putative glycoside hydrolase [Armatimonadota bacterium]